MRPPRWVVRWVARTGPLVYIESTTRTIDALMRSGRGVEFSGSTWAKTVAPGAYRLVASDD